MTQEQKQLLLKDLCGRLPYGVKINLHNAVFEVCFIEKEDSNDVYVGLKENDKNTSQQTNLSNVKPYIRPMSSMTEEEKEDYNSKFEGRDFSWEIYYGSTDWLNAHHFDYRGLIEKGLALEAPEGIYNIK